MTEEKIREIEELRQRLEVLESEVSTLGDDKTWSPPSYYAVYHLMGGMVLGVLGAGASLLFNIIGATMVGLHPLELIRVYLTFPLGEKALQSEDGFALAAGCCLYLGTGMILGVPVHMILERFARDSKLYARVLVATVLGLAVWALNFYGILLYAQPWLIGGSWIVDEIPVPVAAATHVLFAWTVLAAGRLARFVPHTAHDHPRI